MGSPEAEFVQRWGAKPALVIRAPGRVNLIGEHTDYNGLPVMPFAIEQSHRLAVGEGQPGVMEIANVDPAYAAKTIRLEDMAEFSPAGQWDNYLRATILGLQDAGLLGRELESRGLRILVSSSLPARVGLSSSSALVVGFALAALHVCGIPYDRLKLAEVLAEAEHYVGTRGGGMDQTVCLLGQPGHVLRIDFFPLQVEPVVFAGDVEIYLADSGVHVEKSGQNRAQYNRRPIECRLALAVFQTWARANARDELTQAKYWGDLVKPPLGLSHDPVLSMIFQALAKAGSSLDGDAGVLATVVSELKKGRFHDARFWTILEGFGKAVNSAQSIATELGISELELKEMYLKIGPDDYLTEPDDGFKLWQRAVHVIAEAWRVEKAVEALRRADWQELGNLLDASHASCRHLYEISCPELDRLVDAAGFAGALGSRLTGAGFGGCALHLVRRADAGRFLHTMKQLLGESLTIFTVAPSGGAEMIKSL
jgi:N-acetylgalactosamine kinase